MTPPRARSTGTEHLAQGEGKTMRRGPIGGATAVTGAAGFIGSHLCDAILANGETLIGVDNLHTGRMANIAHLLENPRFSFVRHDVVDPLPGSLPRLRRIFNLACPASPAHYQAQPVRTALTCAYGAANGLSRARADGALFIHASTSEVYGDPEIHPQSETYLGNVNCIGPRSCYDEGKRFAETLVIDHVRQHGLHVRIARIFNTYGPRMQCDDGRVVSNFIVQALTGEDITLYGDGQQTRSFCYVDDLVDGLLRLAAADDAVFEPVNLGNPVEITVAELAERVIAMTGSSSRIVHRPLPADDPRRRRPDITRARKAVAWSPRTSLEVGLRHTISYFEGEISRRDARENGRVLHG